MTNEQLVALITQFRKETEDLIWAAMLQYYFNDGVPYTDVNQVKSIITADKRTIYMTVNIAGTEYWFLPDLETLEPKYGSVSIQVASGTVFYRKTPGIGNPEVQTLETLKADLGIVSSASIAEALALKVDKVNGKSLISDLLILKIHDKFAPDEAAIIQEIWDFLNALVLTEENYTTEEKTKLALLKQNVFTVSLPTGDVSERALGAAGGPGVVNWTFAAAANPNDLLITHNLNREISGVTVFYLDGSERIQLMGNLGHTGLSGTLNAVTIKGLSTKAFPLIIHLTFS